MRILITGNLGYLGSCVMSQLRLTWPGARLTGIDKDYFAGCDADAGYGGGSEPDQQLAGDVRDLAPSLFSGADAVVHLAALSRETGAAGDRLEDLAGENDIQAGLELARRAKKSGVKSFVFASSWRVNEISGDATPFARSKAEIERALWKLAGKDFTVTCLRLGSVCGLSRRLRVDGGLNFLAASAAAGEEIAVSNGKAWLPLIHIRDMARTVDWAVARPPTNGGAFVAVNIGSEAWTWQAGDLARMAAGEAPVASSPAQGAERGGQPCGKANFDVFRRLAPLHQPRESLTGTISEMKAQLGDFFRMNGSYLPVSGNSRELGVLAASEGRETDFRCPDAAKRNPINRSPVNRNPINQRDLETRFHGSLRLQVQGQAQVTGRRG